MDFIRSQFPFDRLTQAELALVEENLETLAIPPGTVILHQGGEPCRYLYVVKKGIVHFLRDGRTARILEEGDMFGFPSMLNGGAPAVDVVAQDKVFVYAIPEGVFHELVKNVDFAEFFLKSLSERLRSLSPFPGTSSLSGNITAPVEQLIARPPIFVPKTASVEEAAKVMRRAWASSVLVEGSPPGIVTDYDLRTRVLANGLGPETPVADVMSCPVKSLTAESPVYGALLYMLQENIHHLPLTRHEDIVGVVTDTDLLRFQAKNPLFLLKQLERMDSAENLSRYSLDVAGTVETLAQGGLDVPRIGRIVGSLNAALVRKLLQLAEAELGPPPTPYTWVVFGSGGRWEQVILTDQDNALIYEEESPAAEKYFAELSAHMANNLMLAGFPECPGGYMATNWRKPLAAWIEIFNGWIETPSPHALMEVGIFFDFRPVFGTLSLKPLENLLIRAGRNKIFLAHLANAALQFHPPIGFLWRIRNEGGWVDLKTGGIAPVVGLARAYGLESRAAFRATIDRLHAAADAGALSKSGADMLIETFSFLMRLRLKAQLESIKNGEPPTNKLQLNAISSLERRHLKDAFMAIRDMQSATAQRFRTDFLG